MTAPTLPQHPARSYTLLDAIPLPLYVWRRADDGVLRLVAANAAASSVTSGFVNTLIGIDARELYADEPQIVRNLERTLDDGTPRRIEHLYRMRSTGEQRWISTSYTRSADGDVLVQTEDLTERRAAEARLEESEARFRAAFEQGAVAMSLTGFDGQFLKVNAAFCAMLGYSESELLASTFMALTHPDDLAHDVARKEQLWSGAISDYHMEKRFMHADGRTVWADLSVRRIPGADGTPLYLLAQMQDITARKQVEARHARERADLAHLLERAPAVICTLRGPEHVYEMANEECLRFIGRTNVIGKRVRDVVPEIVEQGLLAVLDQVLESGEPFAATAMPAMLNRVPDMPPETRYVNVMIRPIEQTDGTRSGLFMHVVDVTDLVDAVREHERLASELGRERARLAAVVEQLRASQERHELVLKATNDVIYDWDVATGVIFFSDAIVDAFGYPREALREGYEWWIAQMHPEDRDCVTRVDTAIRGGAQFWSGEYRFRRGDGSYATVLDRGHVVRDDAGMPRRMIGSMSDVSERRQLEAQLRESQKMEAVGRLAGGVAHDFNNLLCAILGYADLALMDTHETSTVRDEIQEIRKAAQRAAQLTKQLLAFGRRQIRRPIRLDVNAVVCDTDRLLTQLLGEQIQLLTQPLAPHAVVHMDPSELDQILVNLAVNARDAMPHGGTVTVETSRATLPASATVAGRVECVVITVSDTGCGIEPDTLAHIFEPFFTTKGEAGTGLGLSTVYGIVKQVGGHIDVQSTVGSGTRFQVYLPAAAGDASRIETPRRATPVLADSATVLLAEDENGVRALAHRLLERAGFHVLEARHGADALLLWNQHAAEIDVVVTDLVMPEMGGRELAELLHRSHPELPVLFMSGYSDDEVTRRGVADPRVAFLAKPFTADSLVNAVRDALRHASRGAPR